MLERRAPPAPVAPRRPWHQRPESTPVASRWPDPESPGSGCSSHRSDAAAGSDRWPRPNRGGAIAVLPRPVDAPPGIAADSRSRRYARMEGGTSSQQARSVGKPSRGPVSSSSVSTQTRSVSDHFAARSTAEPRHELTARSSPRPMSERPRRHAQVSSPHGGTTSAASRRSGPPRGALQHSSARRGHWRAACSPTREADCVAAECYFW